jgi:hypothetical protein
MRNTVVSSAGAGNAAVVGQKIEGVETLSGRTATLSFWAKADASKNIAVEFIQNFGTSGSPSTAVDGIESQLVALTTSWTKYTVTVDLPSMSGKTLGTDGNDWLAIYFWFDAGSDYNDRTASLGQQSGTFDIAQVQLEEGSVATPFEQRPRGAELDLCYRYYIHQLPVAATGYATGNGQTARCGAFLNFPTAVRTVDWTSSYGLSQSGSVNNTPNFSVKTVTGACIFWTSSTSTAQSTWWAGWIRIDAEL